MWDLKLRLFAGGSAIIIVTTVLLGFWAPRKSVALQKLEDEVREVERRFSIQFQHMRDFQIEEAKGLEMRSALMMLEVMDAKGSPQYQRLLGDSAVIKQNSLILLATAGGLSVTGEMIDHWKTLTHDALEEEKRALALQAQPALQDLLNRKGILQKEKDSGQDTLTRWLLRGGLAQALGLLLVAGGEILSRLGR